MPKREAERLARDIWAAKDEQEAATGQRTSLAEATAAFLERRFFSVPRLVTEVCCCCGWTVLPDVGLCAGCSTSATAWLQ